MNGQKKRGRPKKKTFNELLREKMAKLADEAIERQMPKPVVEPSIDSKDPLQRKKAHDKEKQKERHYRYDHSEKGRESQRRRAQLKWKHEHRDEENERRRKWEAKNPDKVKAYREKAKPAIKKWAEEHRDRVRELGRKSDAKRRNSEKRKAWEAAYRQTPEYKARARERDRIRHSTPEYRAKERERSKRRREAAKVAKTKEVA